VGSEFITAKGVGNEFKQNLGNRRPDCGNGSIGSAYSIPDFFLGICCSRIASDANGNATLAVQK
jgi:hypothetical protein